jgi:hypothetical protein
MQSTKSYLSGWKGGDTDLGPIGYHVNAHVKFESLIVIGLCCYVLALRNSHSQTDPYIDDYRTGASRTDRYISILLSASSP